MRSASATARLAKKANTTNLKMHGCRNSSKSAKAVSDSTTSGRTHGSPKAAELFERLSKQSSCATALMTAIQVE